MWRSVQTTAPPTGHIRAVAEATVIAVDRVREVFVLEDDGGACGVFWVLEGPVIHTGDKLDGNVARKGRCQFAHARGLCVAASESGPTTRDRALRILLDGH
jgi:hypothetical protein